MTKLKFNELGLSSEIIKAILDLGFEEATPIQSLAIPKMMSGIDIIGQAQTGTGKTAAFGIPILEKINVKNKAVQAIILCPTRELAIQVAEELKLFSKYKGGLSIVPVYGGQPINRQITALSGGVQIVIGTPGRVIDHLERKTLKLDAASIVVLDEADEMLDMGFRDDIERILGKMPEERQTVFFSATMPKEFLFLTRKYQRHPETIRIVNEQSTTPLIEQYYFDVREHQKFEALTRCLDMYGPKLSLVFCNTKKRVDEVASSLQAIGYSADAIHGDMSQIQRDRVMTKFRSGAIKFLIATDVAARGIDVDDISMVFNYDIPKDDEDYVHRIGRTGRAGKTGKAYSFASGRDSYKLMDIQRYTRVNIKRIQVPTFDEVRKTREGIMVDKVRETLKEKGLEKYIEMAKPLISKETDPLRVAAALFKMKFDSEKKEREQKADVFANVSNDKYAGTRTTNRGMVRLCINVGTKNNVGAEDIINAIEEEAKISRDLVKNIKISAISSFFNIPRENVDNVIKALRSKDIKGRRISIKLAEDPRHQRKTF
ncbi:RNA helicase [Endomicrobiia bacterium]|nr:RNA helicase [Endomicrobiia bacterium]